MPKEDKYLYITGYFKDDKAEFEGYKVKTDEEFDENDDDVFFYGMREDIVKDLIKVGEDTPHDFVITNYNK